MALNQLARVLLKWWWLIVLSMLTASIPTYLGTRASQRTYVSRTTLLVGQTLQSLNPNASEFSTGRALAQSYADLAKGEPILRASLETLELDWELTTLKGMIGSRAIPGTFALEISVSDTDPQRARVLADEMANQLILQSLTGGGPQKETEREFVLSQIQGLRTNIRKSQQDMHDLDDVIARATSARQIQDARDLQAALHTQLSGWQATYARLVASLQEGAANPLRVVEPAGPSVSVDPRTSVNTAIAAAIGFVLAAGVALLLEYIDDSLTGFWLAEAVKKNSLRLALLGAGAGVILVATFALSLPWRQTLKGASAPTRAAVVVPVTVYAPIPVDTTTSTATVAEHDINVAQRQTDEALPRSAAATGTAAAGATATPSVLNTSAAQQAAGFLNCETIDFEILKSPVDITFVTTRTADVEFVWRVRNTANMPYCKWGLEGQETKLVRATEVGGQLGASMPAKLKWIDDDEYVLSLTARLGIGQHDLWWRLLLPSTNSPSGPELHAKAVVLAPTPARAPTLTRTPTSTASPTSVPTSTPCPEKVYECNCEQVCSGRTCTRVCDECTRQDCN